MSPIQTIEDKDERTSLLCGTHNRTTQKTIKKNEQHGPQATKQKTEDGAN
jgi:hypothetical protein